MKKHILKKFLHQITLPEEIANTVNKSGLNILINGKLTVQKIPKGMTPYLTTEDNKIFKAFSFQYKNQTKIIPEPDPILVYFHAAYLNYIQIEEKKQEILDKLSEHKLSEVMINELYGFFSVTSSFVILLFTAIEALTNRCIKKDFIYKKINNRRTELYTKTQIEKYFPFDEKIDEVLPDATGKNFKKHFPMKYSHINNLKDFRDMIAHTKEADDDSTYDYLYKKALTFLYTDTLDAAKDFCNYYVADDFIVECPCSQQW